MKFYLLDGAGAIVLLIIPVAIIFFFIIWGLVEGLMIYLFKIQSFRPAIKQALFINLVSLLVGCVMLGLEGAIGTEVLQITDQPESLPGWILFWVVTVMVEALMLKRLNQTISWKTIYLVSVLMNIITYIILYVFVQSWL